MGSPEGPKLPTYFRGNSGGGGIWNGVTGGPKTPNTFSRKLGRGGGLGWGRRRAQNSQHISKETRAGRGSGMGSPESPKPPTHFRGNSDREGVWNGVTGGPKTRNIFSRKLGRGGGLEWGHRRAQNSQNRFPFRSIFRQNYPKPPQIYGNIHQYAYYFVDLLVGHPVAQRTSVIVDTGSSLCGYPCAGCAHCGQHIDAAFDVTKSPSAKWVPCSAKCRFFL